MELRDGLTPLERRLAALAEIVHMADITIKSPPRLSVTDYPDELATIWRAMRVLALELGRQPEAEAQAIKARAAQAEGGGSE